MNYVLLKNVNCKVMFTEAYLESSKTSTMELFAEIVNSLYLLFIFAKCSLVDVQLGSRYASGSLDTPCKIAPLNSFISKYLYQNQFEFSF